MRLEGVAGTCSKETICYWIQQTLHASFLEALKQSWQDGGSKQMFYAGDSEIQQQQKSPAAVGKNDLELCIEFVRNMAVCWSKVLEESDNKDVSEWVLQVYQHGLETLWSCPTYNHGQLLVFKKGSTFAGQEPTISSQVQAPANNSDSNPNSIDSISGISGFSNQNPQPGAAAQEPASSPAQTTVTAMPGGQRKFLNKSDAFCRTWRHPSQYQTEQLSLKSLSALVEAPHTGIYNDYIYNQIPFRLHFTQNITAAHKFQIIPKTLSQQQRQIQQTYRIHRNDNDNDDNDIGYNNYAVDGLVSDGETAAVFLDVMSNKKRYARKKHHFLHPQEAEQEKKRPRIENERDCMFPRQPSNVGSTFISRHSIQEMARVDPSSQFMLHDFSEPPIPLFVFGALQELGYATHVNTYGNDNLLFDNHFSKKDLKRLKKDRLGTRKRMHRHQQREKELHSKFIPTVDRKEKNKEYWDGDLSNCFMDITSVNSPQKRILCAFRNVEISLLLPMSNSTLKIS